MQESNIVQQRIMRLEIFRTRQSPSAYVSRSPNLALLRLSFTSWMTTLDARSKNIGITLATTAGCMISPLSIVPTPMSFTSWFGISLRLPCCPGCSVPRQHTAAAATTAKCSMTLPL